LRADLTLGSHNLSSIASYGVITLEEASSLTDVLMTLPDPDLPAMSPTITIRGDILASSVNL
jgi:hypothetical protein